MEEATIKETSDILKIDSFTPTKPAKALVKPALASRCLVVMETMLVDLDLPLRLRGSSL